MECSGLGLLPAGSSLPALLDYRAVMDHDISVKKDDILQVRALPLLDVWTFSTDLRIHLSQIQDDQLIISMFFWFIVKSDLSS